MPTVPFADAGEPEVIARVAFAMVAREYWKDPTRKRSGPVVLSHVLAAQTPRKMALLTTALISLQYHLIARRGTAAEWRSIAVAGSRLGYNFRQCFYADYKANRRR